MIELTVGEELVVLGLDSGGRLNVQRYKFDFHLAGAALAELRLRGRVTANDVHITPGDTPPTSNPILDEAYRRFGDGERRVERAIWAVSKTVRRVTLTHLHDCGVLWAQPGGLLRSTRYLERNHSLSRIRRSLVDRLNAATSGQSVEPRTALLAAFVSSLGWGTRILDKPTGHPIVTQLAVAGETAWGPQAVRRALDFIRAPH